MSSFLRHSLRDTVEQRRQRERRERERRNAIHGHRSRRAKVAKMMLVGDELALVDKPGKPRVNPYSAEGATRMAEFFESFTADQRQAFAEVAGFDHASPETWDMLVEGYRERVQGPHCGDGLSTMSLERLQAFGGELQTLVDGASDAERLESWWAYARATEREVHFEIALRARRVAS